MLASSSRPLGGSGSGIALAFVAIAMVGVVVVACNAISGVDGLDVDQTGQQDPAVGTSSGTSSSGASGASGGSTSSTTSSGSTGEAITHERDPDAAVDAPSSSELDATFDSTTTAPPSFTDLFDRADSPTIGNGWLEKTADKYSISANSVLHTGIGSYTNNILYRPEASLDVQASFEVTYGSSSETDPSLHLRMQPSSTATGELDSYSFYAYRDYAAISREDPGDNGTDLSSVTLSPELVVGTKYKITFRVIGTNPVKLDASITKVSDGSSVTALTASDASGERITAAGKVGFGAGKADGTRFDNFVRNDL